MVVNDLEFEDVCKVMQSLGADRIGLKFKSICHNGTNHNLVYFPNSKSFYCFSCCQKVFSLSDIVQRTQKCDIAEANNYIKNIIHHTFVVQKCQNIVQSCENKPKPLPDYDNSILDKLDTIYDTDWLEYGISVNVLKKYNIKYYSRLSQIVIPIKLMNNQLVGIKVRNSIPELVKKTKYTSLMLLDGTEFNFPSSEVFFGEQFNIPEIKKQKSAIIVEAEKTVMKYDTWFPESNNTLGIFGSAISTSHLNKLKSWGVDTLYIALDSDYINRQTLLYRDFVHKVIKFASKCQKHGFNNIYVIYNNLDILDSYKYSITDYSKHDFIKLWLHKETIENFKINNKKEIENYED